MLLQSIAIILATAFFIGVLAAARIRAIRRARFVGMLKYSTPYTVERYSIISKN